jgi:hypothetical protein
MSHASIGSELRDAITSAGRAPGATHNNAPLKKFARNRLKSAERSLHRSCGTRQTF